MPNYPDSTSGGLKYEKEHSQKYWNQRQVLKQMERNKIPVKISYEDMQNEQKLDNYMKNSVECYYYGEVFTSDDTKLVPSAQGIKAWNPIGLTFHNDPANFAYRFLDGSGLIFGENKDPEYFEDLEEELNARNLTVKPQVTEKLKEIAEKEEEIRIEAEKQEEAKRKAEEEKLKEIERQKEEKRKEEERIKALKEEFVNKKKGDLAVGIELAQIMAQQEVNELNRVKGLASKKPFPMWFHRLIGTKSLKRYQEGQKAISEQQKKVDAENLKVDAAKKELQEFEVKTNKENGDREKVINELMAKEKENPTTSLNLETQIAAACQTYDFPAEFKNVLHDSLQELYDLSKEEPCKTQEQLNAREKEYINKIGPVMIFAYMAGRRREMNDGKLGMNQQISSTEKNLAKLNYAQIKEKMYSSILNPEDARIRNAILDYVIDPSKINNLLEKNIITLTTDFYKGMSATPVNGLDVATKYNRFAKSLPSEKPIVSEKNIAEPKEKVIADSKDIETLQEKPVEKKEEAKVPKAEEEVHEEKAPATFEEQVIRSCSDNKFPKGFTELLTESVKDLRSLSKDAACNTKEELTARIEEYTEKLGPVVLFAYMAGRRIEENGSIAKEKQQPISNTETKFQGKKRNSVKEMLPGVIKDTQLTSLRNYIVDCALDPSKIENLLSMDMDTLTKDFYKNTLKQGLTLKELTEKQQQMLTQYPSGKSAEVKAKSEEIPTIAVVNGSLTPEAKEEPKIEVETKTSIGLEKETLIACKTYGFPEGFDKLLSDSFSQLQDISKDQPCKTQEEVDARYQSYMEKLGPVLTFGYIAGRRLERNDGVLAKSQGVSSLEMSLAKAGPEKLKTAITKSLKDPAYASVLNTVVDYLKNPSKINNLTSMDFDTFTNTFFKKELRAEVSASNINKQLDQLKENLPSDPSAEAKAKTDEIKEVNEQLATKDLAGVCREYGFPKGFDKILADSLKELPKLASQKPMADNSNQFHEELAKYQEKLGPLLIFTYMAGSRLEKSGGTLAKGQDRSGTEIDLAGRDWDFDSLKNRVNLAAKSFTELPGITYKVVECMENPSKINELLNMNVQQLKTEVFDKTLRRGIYSVRDTMNFLNGVEEKALTEAQIEKEKDYSPFHRGFMQEARNNKIPEDLMKSFTTGMSFFENIQKHPELNKDRHQFMSRALIVASSMALTKTIMEERKQNNGTMGPKEKEFLKDPKTCLENVTKEPNLIDFAEKWHKMPTFTNYLLNDASGKEFKNITKLVDVNNLIKVPGNEPKPENKPIEAKKETSLKTQEAKPKEQKKEEAKKSTEKSAGF